MNLTTYIVGASLALTGIVYGYFTLKNRAAEARLEASILLAKAWEKEFAGAKATADENIAAVERIRADLKRQEEVAAKAQAAERKRTAELNAAKKRIQDAPKSDDGPISPILRNALDRLRPDGDGAPAADSADKDPSGTPASEPVGVPVPGDAPAT